MERYLKFGERKVKPEVRMLKEMEEVIYDKDWFKKAENFPIYYMYRDLSLNEKDRKKIKKANLRYDLTFIPPKMLGCEYVKTLGHYHPCLPHSSLTYPEIYEILEGKAYYLLQNLTGGKVSDVILIEAKKGDFVVIPPGYGHITINPSSRELKMANLVARNFSPLYGPIKERKGGAYFKLEQGWVRNENYLEFPEIRVLKPVKGIFRENIYLSFLEQPSLFEFLTKPQLYPGLFEEIKMLKSI